MHPERSISVPWVLSILTLRCTQRPSSLFLCVLFVCYVAGAALGCYSVMMNRGVCVCVRSGRFIIHPYVTAFYYCHIFRLSHKFQRLNHSTGFSFSPHGRLFHSVSSASNLQLNSAKLILIVSKLFNLMCGTDKPAVNKTPLCRGPIVSPQLARADELMISPWVMRRRFKVQREKLISSAVKSQRLLLDGIRPSPWLMLVAF